MLLNTSLDEYSWGTTDYEKAKPRYLHIVGPHYDDLSGTITGPAVIQQDTRRPWQVSVFKRELEGVCWTGDSRQYLWDDGLFKDRASFSLTKTDDSIAVDFSPLRQNKLIDCGEKLCFNWYLILPNVPVFCRKKYFEVAVQTNPFPDPEMVRSWAKSGVNLIRIHDDSDAGGTDFYWHDGSYPPYNPEKMQKLKAFIKLCHSLGLKIIPYFSGWELSPDTKSFALHGRQWYAPGKPNGHIRYTPSGGAAVFGALMCQDSGWNQFLTRRIKKVVDTLDFDGYYLDWSGPGACFNSNHLPGEHNGADGFVNMLENTRQWLGENRIMVIHAGGQICWLMHHNIADQIVTLEEGKRDGGDFTEISEYPFSVELMSSASIGIVPNVLCDSPGMPPTMKLKRGIAHLVHLNAVPYMFVNSQLFGYKDWQKFIRAGDSVFALFRKFSRIDFTKYRFYGPRSGVVSIENRQDNVVCSAYVGKKDILTVISNQTGKKVPRGVVVVYHLKDSKPIKVEISEDFQPYEVKILKSVINAS